MTLKETISRFDLLYPNTLPYDVKRDMVSAVEGRLITDIISLYGHSPQVRPFDAETDPDTPLAAAFPFDDIYLKYLVAENDLINGDIARYNNHSAVFTAAWDAYASFLRRTHLQKGSKVRLPEVTA